MEEYGSYQQKCLFKGIQMIVALISPLYIIYLDQVIMLCYLKILKYMSQSKDQREKISVASPLHHRSSFFK